MIPEGYTPLTSDKGFLLLKIPQDIISDIKTTVDVVKNNFTTSSPANLQLAGQIDKEYHTTLEPNTTQYIRDVVDKYLDESPQFLNPLLHKFTKDPFVLSYRGDAWINFQEKYEYNPLHDHSGILSYVIWYHIPYHKEDEIKYGAGKGKQPHLNTNGNFEFFYNLNERISTTSLAIDKKMEGYMAMFPSNLNHAVNPFYTSDDYRITLSGNIYLTPPTSP
mgnify:CR=1 FL=1